MDICSEELIGKIEVKYTSKNNRENVRLQKSFHVNSIDDLPTYEEVIARDKQISTSSTTNECTVVGTDSTNTTTLNAG